MHAATVHPFIIRNHFKNNTGKLLTSLAICKNPITICFAKLSLSPQHISPSVYSALSFTLDGSFAFPTILNSRSATKNFVTSSVAGSFDLLMLKGLSHCNRVFCLGELSGRGKPLHRTSSTTADTDVLMSKVCGLARKFAVNRLKY